jgi:hypothetical protein
MELITVYALKWFAPHEISCRFVGFPKISGIQK